jgi:energy-coupling factor transporter ATP-binding protein EcfA2
MMNFEETLKAVPLFFKTKLVPLLLGHTGIGKTELLKQMCQTLEMDLIVLHVAQLEPSDFVGLYQTTDDGRTRNCPPNWLPYKGASKVESKDKAKVEVIKFMANEHVGEINPKGGILFLDEINRGHEDIRQALYQLLTDKRIHTYSLPENYHIVSAANPSNGYEVYEFDAALVNRFAWIKFKPNVLETIKYLEGKHGNNAVTSWIKTDKALVEMGDDDFKVDGMKFTPRTFENMIMLFNEIQEETKEFKRKVLETIAVPEKVLSFLNFQEELKHCNWQDVLAGKKKEKVEQLVKDSRLDVLSTIVASLGELFSSYKIGETKHEAIPEGKEKEYIKNAVDFLQVIPDELVTTFLDYIPREFLGVKGCLFGDSYFKTKIAAKLGKYAKLYKDKV